MSEFMKGLIEGKTPEQMAQEVVNETLNQEIESSNNKIEKASEKWEPQEWRPEYQYVITLSSLGKSAQDIVDWLKEKYEISFTRQHVYNILNCKLGKAQMARMTGNIVKRSELEVEEAMEKMTSLAANRVVQLMEDEERFKEQPFAVVDRAIKILEGRQKLRHALNNGNMGAQVQNNNFFNLPSNIQQRIDRGLKNLSRIDEIHGSESGSGESEERSGTDG